MCLLLMSPYYGCYLMVLWQVNRGTIDHVMYFSALHMKNFALMTCKPDFVPLLGFLRLPPGFLIMGIQGQPQKNRENGALTYKSELAVILTNVSDRTPLELLNLYLLR